MAEGKISNLDLVSTDDLIEELAIRHKEIIIIREYKKGINEDRVFVKTDFGKKGRKDKGFDLINITEMLHAAHRKLIYNYLDDIK